MIIWQVPNTNMAVADEKKKLLEYTDMGFTFEDFAASKLKLTVKWIVNQINCLGDKTF
jgi:hypothetical protein